MIIPDVNLLLYVHLSSFPQHARALEWWEKTVASGAYIGLPWIIITGFVRLSTSPRIQKTPLTVEQALSIVDEWLALPNLHVIEPGPSHYTHFRRIASTTAGGGIITDVHIAALAIELNAVLASNDADFARISGLKWFNPLKGE